jgi:hypothetical protein
MDAQIIAVYCLSTDILTGLRHRNDGQCRLTDGEVRTIVLVAVLFFRDAIRMYWATNDQEPFRR